MEGTKRTERNNVLGGLERKTYHERSGRRPLLSNIPRPGLVYLGPA